jgi:CubicO group peptidase (beta-lactamase class C family)
VYLQKTIEKVTGKSIQWLAEEFVFKPLKMIYLRNLNRSFPHDKDGKRIIKTRPREVEIRNIPYMQRVPQISDAAGAMWSSMRDFTHFLHYLLFGEDHQSKKILKSFCTEQIFFTDWNVTWGLGVGIQQYTNKKVLWHWGDDAGFKTFTFNIIGIGGITIFTNGNNGRDLYTDILDFILGESPEKIKSERQNQN